MTLFFPDVNVWLALSDAGHAHHRAAWKWLASVTSDERLILSRFTQLGLFRLLTNSAVMGDQTLTLRKAWAVYDRWLDEPRVEFYPEPRNAEIGFRMATEPFAEKPASKWVGDCWLLSFAQTAGASLVTFDQTLRQFARKQGVVAVIPA